MSDVPSQDPAVVPVQQPVAVQADVPPAVALPIAQSLPTTPVVPQPISTGKSKELGSVSAEVTAPIEVVGSDAIEQEPIPPEVEKWMEKVNRGEQAPDLSEVVVSQPQSPTVGEPYARQPVFVLPLGEQDIAQGSHASVSTSIRWLATWCGRIMKKLGGHVAYRQG